MADKCYTCRFCKMDIRDGKPYCSLRVKGRKCYDHDSWESQKDVLDKIIAEIDKIYKREGNSVDCLNALDELKWVIDKYKTESEE